MALEKDISWLHAHEKLLLGAVLALVIIFGINKYVNYAAVKAHEEAAVSAQILETQKAQNAALKAQMDQDRVTFQQELASLTAANQTLQQGIVNLQANLNRQRKVDQTLPLPELAQRWQGLAGLTDSEISAVPNGVSVSESGARKTTQALEAVPVLIDELTAQRQLTINDEKIIASCQNSLDSTGAVVVGLQTELEKTKKADQDEMKVLKADARKGKRNWFIAGFVTGIATRLLLKF